jgi:hypothetical protein
MPLLVSFSFLPPRTKFSRPSHEWRIDAARLPSLSTRFDLDLGMVVGKHSNKEATNLIRSSCKEPV